VEEFVPENDDLAGPVVEVLDGVVSGEALFPVTLFDEVEEVLLGMVRAVRSVFLWDKTKKTIKSRSTNMNRPNKTDFRVNFTDFASMFLF
jgi:hypothetical protein